MSLTKEAMEFLQQQFLKAAMGNPPTERPSVVLPDNLHLVSLEPFQRYRNSYRGTFTTGSFDDFINYCAGHSDDAVCFVDVDTMTAKMIFDLGTDSEPGHCEHKATLKLKATPAHEALTSFVGHSRSQAEVFNFLQDWKPLISVYEDYSKETVVTFAEASHRIRNVEIDASTKAAHEEGDFSRQKSSSARVEMKASDNRKLPAIISMGFVPYLGFDPISFDLQVGIALVKDQPMISLRIIGEELLREQIANEFVHRLFVEFDQDRVIRGAFAP